MNKYEILSAFIQAEKDWSEPIDVAFDNKTEEGLCWYFIVNQAIEKRLINDVLRPIWQEYKTNETPEFGMDFFGYGYTTHGRRERLEAIRKVINDLKKEINELH